MNVKIIDYIVDKDDMTKLTARYEVTDEPTGISWTGEHKIQIDTEAIKRKIFNILSSNLDRMIKEGYKSTSNE